jgi:hypothetical protein
MQFVVLLIAVALVVKYWWVIFGVCVVGWLIWSLVSGYRRARDELEWERQPRLTASTGCVGVRISSRRGAWRVIRAACSATNPRLAQRD